MFIIDEALLLNPDADLQHELGGTRDDMSRDHLPAMSKARGFEVLRGLEEQCRVVGVPVRTELMLGEARQSEMLSLGRRGGNRDHQSDRWLKRPSPN